MKTLGILWIAYGMVRACLGIVQFLFAPTATVMFGALLTRVADYQPLMAFFHGAYTFFILISFACGILGILGGVLSMGNSGSGRSMLIVASLLALTEMPIGIALGVYTLIVLIPARTAEKYS